MPHFVPSYMCSRGNNFPGRSSFQKTHHAGSNGPLLNVNKYTVLGCSTLGLPNSQMAQTLMFAAMPVTSFKPSLDRSENTFLLHFSCLPGCNTLSTQKWGRKEFLSLVPALSATLLSTFGQEIILSHIDSILKRIAPNWTSPGAILFSSPVFRGNDQHTFTRSPKYPPRNTFSNTPADAMSCVAPESSLIECTRKLSMRHAADDPLHVCDTAATNQIFFQQVRWSPGPPRITKSSHLPVTARYIQLQNEWHQCRKGKSIWLSLCRSSPAVLIFLPPLAFLLFLVMSGIASENNTLVIHLVSLLPMPPKPIARFPWLWAIRSLHQTAALF